MDQKISQFFLEPGNIPQKKRILFLMISEVLPFSLIFIKDDGVKAKVHEALALIRDEGSNKKKIAELSKQFRQGSHGTIANMLLSALEDGLWIAENGFSNEGLKYAATCASEICTLTRRIRRDYHGNIAFATFGERAEAEEKTVNQHEDFLQSICKEVL